MHPHQTALTLLPLLLMAGWSPAAANETRTYSASAFSLDGGELLYTETHTEVWTVDGLARRQVRYEDPAGRLIAEKEVRYGNAVEAPSFEMTDFRIGLKEGAEVAAETVVLFSGPTDKPVDERRIDRPRGAVIDAGFDAFMRQNFSSIAAGEKLEFEFAVPAIQRFVKFRLVPQGRTDYRGEPALRVEMKPANALVRLLVDPIDLVYGLDGRLLEFRGLANVCDEDGERYQARIVFDYPDGGREAPTLTTAS